MKKLFITIIMFISSFSTNIFADGQVVKVGIILGFTGPIKSLTPAMAASAELAFKEASESGSLLGGKKIKVIRADSTCVDSAAAVAAGEEIVSQGVTAIIGGTCPDATNAIAFYVAIPNKIVMISPSATSLKLTMLNDNGYFFRTAPSDARGSQILADITKDRNIKSVAITYVDNEYEKSLADIYKTAVKAHGINVTTMIAHKNGKTDYSSEVATLASAGGEAVTIFSYLDQGGKGIIQASLHSGAFDKFILSDGMIGKSLVDTFGKDLKKSFGSTPGSIGKGAGVFANVASYANINSFGPYTGESYDAAALIVLAMQSGRSSNSDSIAKNVMNIANGPGVKIYPGELKKGLDLLAEGKAIDYEGATGVTFTESGDAEGSFLEQEIKGGKFKTKKQR